MSYQPKIDVVAPAGGDVGQEILLQNQAMAQSLGLSLRVPTHLLRREIFFSNAEQYRYDTLLEAINSDAEVIWAYRGGYGSALLIPQLMKLSKPAQEKMFIGFSDITALHLFFNQHWRWKTVHAMTVNKMMKTEEDPENLCLLLDVINKKAQHITVNSLLPMNDIATFGTLQGLVTGGNLSIIQTSLGTPWEIITTDKILILEEITESSYRVHRILNHLMQSDKLQHVKAVIFGTFFKCEDHHGISMQEVLMIFANILNNLKIPVFQTDKIGHGYSNYPFIYGAEAEIKFLNNDAVMKQQID